MIKAEANSMKCKDCINWEQTKDNEQNFGYCKSFKFIEGASYYDAKYDSNSLLYCAGGMDDAGFETGAEFGCIHFERRS